MDESFDDIQTIKQISDSTGISTRELTDIVRRAEIRPTKVNDLWGFSYTEVLDSINEFGEDSKRKNIEWDAQIISRVLPQLSTHIRGIIKEEFSSNILYKESTEAKIVDAITSVKVSTLMLKKISSEILRVLTLVELSEVKTGNHVTAVATPTNSVKPSKEVTVDNEQTIDLSSDAPSGIEEYLSLMFPTLHELEDDQRNAILTAKSDLYEQFISSPNELKRMSEIKRRSINSVIALFSNELGNVPTFKSLAGSMSSLLVWTQQKIDKIPLGIIFSAIEANNIGSELTGDDFVYMTQF